MASLFEKVKKWFANDSGDSNWNSMDGINQNDSADYGSGDNDSDFDFD